MLADVLWETYDSVLFGTVKSTGQLVEISLDQVPSKRLLIGLSYLRKGVYHVGSRLTGLGVWKNGVSKSQLIPCDVNIPDFAL